MVHHSFVFSIFVRDRELTYRRRRLLFALMALFVFVVPSGCMRFSVKAQHLLEAAQTDLGRVRPEARGLSGVQVRTMSDRAAVLPAEKQAEAAAQPPSYSLDVRSALDSALPVLIRMRILSRDDADRLRALDPDTSDSFGLALPATNTILVASLDPSLMVHELTHLLQYRLGYYKRLRSLVYLTPAGAPERPSWINLDALIAYWALLEGGATLTGLVVEAHNSGELKSGWWSEQRDTDWSILFLSTVGGQLTGRAKITFANGKVVKVGAGEKYFTSPGDLAEVLVSFVYTAARPWILDRRNGEENLEPILRRAWAEAPATTAPLLFGKAGTATSRPTYAGSVRKHYDVLSSQISGATSVGALLLADRLAGREGGFDRADIYASVERREDDIMVWDAAGNTAWFVKWADASAAKEFMSVYRALQVPEKGDAEIRTSLHGDRTVVCELGEANALSLLKKALLKATDQ